MAKRKQQKLIKGTASHSRTEADYMSTLLETVTLDDWQEVVSSTLSAAKQGDAPARAWLAHYLVGKPAGKAPTPLTVVVQQLNGDSPLIDRLANAVIHQQKYSSLDEDEAWEEQIKAIITAELAEKFAGIKNVASPETEGLTDNLEGHKNS